MNTSLKRNIALACAFGALDACSQSAANADGHGGAAAPAVNASAASGNHWTDNGATAYDKYLTPDVVAQISPNPAGHAKKLGGQGCSFETPDFASINITLVAGGPAVFDAHQKYLTDPVPLSGVGDKAVRTVTGVEAVKGADRVCNIDVMPPFGNKLKGEPLAQKLGEVCNKLFALP